MAPAKKSSAPKPTLKKNNKTVSKPVNKKEAGKSVAKTKTKLGMGKKTTVKPTGNPTTPKVQKAKTTTQLSPAERMKMIAEAAYYLAEARGFSHGNDVNDWVAAEQQVEAKLKS